jgi:hypothetical protein
MATLLSQRARHVNVLGKSPTTKLDYKARFPTSRIAMTPSVFFASFSALDV